MNAIVKDLALLKGLFKQKMEQKAPEYLALLKHGFNDKDVDALIEYFRDKERRKEFFREYKEIEMLYEIISPDAFLRPFIDDYATLSAIYNVVRRAYTKRINVDKEFQRKTNALVQKHVGVSYMEPVSQFFEINEDTARYIAGKKGDGTKVINLVKSIEKIAEDESEDPFLIAMAERTRAVKERFENRQTTTAEALEELLKEIERNEQRKKEQAEKGFDGLTFFVYRSLLDAGVSEAEETSMRIKQSFSACPNWRQSEAELRELRKEVTFALFSQMDDLDRVTALVDELFNLLFKAYQI